MRRANHLINSVFLCFIFSLFFSPLHISAQEKADKQEISTLEVTQISPDATTRSAVKVPYEEEALPGESLSAADNVTLDFKDADILNVLKIIAYKSGINIVTTPEVMGNVTVRLVDVPWERALDVILKTYGFGYERQENVILVTKAENLAKIQTEEPLKTEIFVLKFLDAQDAEKILIPLLSPRGKISVLYSRGQKGWNFGSFKIGKEEVGGVGLAKEKTGDQKAETVSIERTPEGSLISRKADFDPAVKSKILIISDTSASLDRIRSIILPEIDVMPKQVLIEARIMEVDRNKLRDIGVDFGTGTAGAEGATAPTDLNLNAKNKSSLAGRSLGSKVSPSYFTPLESTTAFTGAYPFTAGAEILFKKLTGDQFEVIVHALEEDAKANLLSAPRVVTLDNQEASILVGYHTPILKSEVTGGTSTEPAKLTQTLDYYQEIGIRLNVVPQISKEGFINMIIHPSVTSSTTHVDATSAISNTTITSEYPIIDVREAQTQILMRDTDTVVLGGLLKDVISKETIGVPFLSQIPLVGGLFRRDTYSTQKVDLLIFISARILKDVDFTPEELSRLKDNLGKTEEELKKEAKANKKRKQ